MLEPYVSQIRSTFQSVLTLVPHKSQHTHGIYMSAPLTCPTFHCDVPKSVLHERMKILDDKDGAGDEEKSIDLLI